MPAPETHALDAELAWTRRPNVHLYTERAGRSRRNPHVWTGDSTRVDALLALAHGGDVSDQGGAGSLLAIGGDPADRARPPRRRRDRGSHTGRARPRRQTVRPHDRARTRRLRTPAPPASNARGAHPLHARTRGRPAGRPTRPLLAPVFFVRADREPRSVGRGDRPDAGEVRSRLGRLRRPLPRRRVRPSGAVAPRSRATAGPGLPDGPALGRPRHSHARRARRRGGDRLAADRPQEDVRAVRRADAASARVGGGGRRLRRPPRRARRGRLRGVRVPRPLRGGRRVGEPRLPGRAGAPDRPDPRSPRPGERAGGAPSWASSKGRATLCTTSSGGCRRGRRRRTWSRCPPTLRADASATGSTPPTGRESQAAAPRIDVTPRIRGRPPGRPPPTRRASWRPRL